MKCHVTVSIKTGPKRPKQFTTKFRTCIQFLVCNINNNRRAADDLMFQTRGVTCHCNLKTCIPPYQPIITMGQLYVIVGKRSHVNTIWTLMITYFSVSKWEFSLLL